jgi:hypothetical protein
METITFNTVRFEKVADGLKIIHIKTGGSIVLSAAQVEKWAIVQLRKLFT